MDRAPQFARIEEAERGIRPQVIETPLDRSRMLSDELGADVWLKADHLQPTGPFKIRGATNKHRTLTDAERARGVLRSEEHTSALQTLMRISYAVFSVKSKIRILRMNQTPHHEPHEKPKTRHRN